MKTQTGNGRSIERTIADLMLATALGCAPWTASSLARSDQLGSSAANDPLVQQLGVSRGICVLIEDVKCETALRLAKVSDLTMYVQLSRAADVEAARKLVDKAGLYGSRIYVEQGAPSNIHLADNIADALVGVGSPPPEKEVLRVLRPQAKALLGKKQLAKPFPKGVDDWSHPYHGPDNNPMSRDEVARAPYLTQFLADPRYAPLPQLAVASAGRVFKAFGHIAFKEREEPWLNTLAAFNGYNGTLLWRRDTSPNLMVHRNIMIATPDILFSGDDKSCKLFDPATGEQRDEIVIKGEGKDEVFWKWMALQDGTLYALIGEQEDRDPTIRLRSNNHGWPWDPLSPGFNRPEHTWGYGSTLAAVDVKTKKVLWQHRESEPVDSRALCMRNGRIYAFRFGAYLVCIDAKTGREIWRKTKESDPQLFEAIGAYQHRQDWRTNWRTTAYLKCSDRALYFAGPVVGKLLALSSDDGHVLWQHPYGNYQLVIRDDSLYGLSGQIDNEVSRKFDPLTGKVLDEIKLGRRACTRPTGSIDAVFCRASGGSVRLDVASDRPELVSPMRAQCHDGVTIANGLLYWWPSVCDCNLTLYGITCLGPAGDFDFKAKASDAERLESAPAAAGDPATLPESPADWPVFRADNRATVTTSAAVPEQADRLWESPQQASYTPTAPIAAGGLVFIGGSDGIIRAFDAATGGNRWRAYTGGAIRHPPTYSKGRLFAGSGDGWVYAFRASDGSMLWRFRAAPAERKVPIYGQLLSTWPAASGVIVEDGIAYVAAGIVNYDGTHVYALDAATGRIKWQNTSSGHMDPVARTGVSVQGHMVLHERRLYLAGGNAVSPGVYDITDGKCLSDEGLVHRTVNNNVPASESPRGCELYTVADQVMVSGKPFYAHPQYGVYDASVLNKTLFSSVGDRDLAWVNNSRLFCYPRIEENRNDRLLQAWRRGRVRDAQPAWEAECNESVALAVGRNAVVVATGSELAAYRISDGRSLWKRPLETRPVPWGLAMDRNGRVLVSLEGGKVACFGASGGKLASLR